MALKREATRVALIGVLVLGVIASRQGSAADRSLLPDVVELAPGTLVYRMPGDFSRAGKPADAPFRTVRIEHTLAIMQRQVSAAEYQNCVDAGACPPIAGSLRQADRPAVGVNWRDARAYAAWLSRATGAAWRLPTDEEWSFAAGSRFNDDVVTRGISGSDPGRRALALYDAATARDDSVAEPQPVGTFGANEHGLVDLAGNVWEWTDSCFVRAVIEADGEIRPTVVNCGIRIAAGRHRAYMPDFLGDARGGGCSNGMQPSNLGFRLVRDDQRWHGLGWLSREHEARR